MGLPMTTRHSVVNLLCSPLCRPFKALLGSVSPVGTKTGCSNDRGQFVEGKLRKISEKVEVAVEEPRIEGLLSTTKRLEEQVRRVSETPATYDDNHPTGGPSEDELTTIGNLDIRVSESMKRIVGQLARRVRKGAEEKEDAGEEEESAKKDVRTMEEREDTVKSVLAVGREEPSNKRPWDSGGDIGEGEGDLERQQLCHVPGGAWL
ncbi:hypothetical protein NDU88_003571 [Pleurodeles waltl]|uniref:Uncharacterized protein n=1 Tax=Pleurodeles waltl TaxID=8319 RepID=A0AAV7M3S3_PLEWA|nr:hypothetical protein NDU88_003571 [Pleurodeles waltl]